MFSFSKKVLAYIAFTALHTSYINAQYCNVEEYLPASNELRDGRGICNSYHDVHLYVKDCELHIDNDWRNCKRKIAETNGDDCKLVMQQDGNIVFYDGRLNSIWKTRTRGDSARMHMNSDGNLFLHVPVVPSQNQRPRSSSSSSYRQKICKGSKFGHGDKLKKNEYICDNKSESYFGINDDGNLVYSRCDDCDQAVIPESYSALYSPDPYIQIHGDGNLVLYDSRARMLWESETRGKSSWVGFHEGEVFIMTSIIDDQCNDVQKEEDEDDREELKELGQSCPSMEDEECAGELKCVYVENGTLDNASGNDYKCRKAHGDQCSSDSDCEHGVCGFETGGSGEKQCCDEIWKDGICKARKDEVCDPGSSDSSCMDDIICARNGNGEKNNVCCNQIVYCFCSSFICDCCCDSFDCPCCVGA